jgi:hypothetical protein
MLKLSIITADKPSVVGKKYFRNADGSIGKKTVGNVFKGRVDIAEYNSFNQFYDLLTSLKNNNALCYGVPYKSGLKLLSDTEYQSLSDDKKPLYVARTKDTGFKWADCEGVLMLDNDPKPEAPALNKEHFIKAVKEAIGCDFSYVWKPSSSSFIYDGDVQYTALKGQRLYIHIKNASDIPRAGKILYKRLFINGFGFPFITGGASICHRNIIDEAVFESNRFDFAGGAICGDGISQRTPQAELHLSSEPLDTFNALRDFTTEEEDKFLCMVAEAKQSVAHLLPEKKRQCIHKTAVRIAKTQNTDSEEYKKAAIIAHKAIEQSILFGDFILHKNNKETFTVAEALENPAKYHNVSICDPFEYESEGYRKCAKIYLMDTRKNLFSQLHGGKNYQLVRTPTELQYIRGHEYEFIESILQVMQQSPDIFDTSYGTSAVRIANGDIQELNKEQLWKWISARINVFQETKKKDETVRTSIALSDNITNKIHNFKHEDRGLKRLSSVITAPILRKDYTVVSRYGYDSKTEFFLQANVSDFYVAEKPTDNDVCNAFHHIRDVFSEFPFEEHEQYPNLYFSVLLSAIFTAALRPILPTSPAFFIDAPEKGTGKTYLAKCIAAIRTGKDIPTLGMSNQEEEVKKEIYALLKQKTPVVLYDNLTGLFNSNYIANILTTSMIEGRNLGFSDTSKVNNSALFLFTGNNAVMVEDMARRVFRIKLNTGFSLLQNATDRKFTKSPLSQCMDDARIKLIQSILTIIRACHVSGYMHNQSKLASYEQWDDYVRNPIMWLCDHPTLSNYVCDPVFIVYDSVNRSEENSPDANLAFYLQSLFGDEWFTARDIKTRISYSVNDSTTKERDLADCFDGMCKRGKAPEQSTTWFNRVMSNRVGRKSNDGLTIQVKIADRYKHYRVAQS